MPQPSQLTTVVFNNPRRGFFPSKICPDNFETFILHKFLYQRLPIHITPHFVFFTPSTFTFITPYFIQNYPYFIQKESVGLCELEIYSLFNCSFPQKEFWGFFDRENQKFRYCSVEGHVCRDISLLGDRRIDFFLFV